MKKGFTIVASFIFLLSINSCDNTDKEINKRLENAKLKLSMNDFYSARNEIDSLRSLYPKNVKALKGALALMREVDYAEAVRNIAYSDSLLPIRTEEFEKLVKDFKFEKDTTYETIGNYIWKQQIIEKNLKRCYIRCGVDETGEMYLASVFFGTKGIEHTSVKLSTPDGLFVETPITPYDGGNNYRFSNLGNTTEVITYKGENAMNAVKFIAANTKNKIRVEYTGGKPYIIYMAESDKKAVDATYKLAVILQEIHQTKTGKEKASKEIEYLQKKLDTSKNKENNQQ